VSASKRSRRAAAAALLLLAGGGCMPADESTPEGGPGAPPPAAADPVPQPAPSSEEGGPWSVTARGIGPVEAGMPLAEAARVLAVEPDTAAAAGRCGYLRSARAPAGVLVMANGGTVARVDVAGGTVRTAEGVGIGDPAERVREAYPGRVAETPHKYTGGTYLVVTPQPPADAGFRLVFETDGGRVTRYRAGRLPEVEWVEGCS
jgi:hypothetical protein